MNRKADGVVSSYNILYDGEETDTVGIDPADLRRRVSVDEDANNADDNGSGVDLNRVENAVNENDGVDGTLVGETEHVKAAEESEDELNGRLELYEIVASIARLYSIGGVYFMLDVRLAGEYYKQASVEAMAKGKFALAEQYEVHAHAFGYEEDDDE